MLPTSVTRLCLACLAFLALSTPSILHADESVRLPITRDSTVSAYPGETDGNNGGSTHLKTKGIIELSLLDFDPALLQGKIITSALLYFKPSGDHQKRVTLSTISSPWTQGQASRYRKTPGAVSFNWARQDQSPWAWPGSDITAVIAGQDNSLWNSANAYAVDASGFQHVEVNPKVIAARVAGLSYGIAMMDDVGSEYTRKGDKFTYHLFPNRFFYSSESSEANRPYLVVTTGKTDGQPPGPIHDLTSSFNDLPAGQCQLTWTIPQRHGPAGVMGFILAISDLPAVDFAMAKRIPAWLVPMPKSYKTTMTLRDLPDVDFTKPHVLYIRAVDTAGNAGPITRFPIPARTTPASSLTLPQPPEPFQAKGDPPVIDQGGAVFVIDELDKLNPVTGQILPAPPQDYKLANHLWSASERTVRLFGARSEFVSFQLVTQSDTAPVTQLHMDDPKINATISRLASVPAAQGPWPDAVVSLKQTQHPSFHEPFVVQGRQYTTQLIELYVPPSVAPGDHKGTIILTQNGRPFTLHINLHIWHFKLPEHLSFIPEMNAYGLGSGPDELAYYRLAQINRTCLNRLPYNWRGQVQPGGAPELTADLFEASKNTLPHRGRGGSTILAGDYFDWTAWDHRFGPLLSGSAFTDLPRGPVPVETFYLPLNENWPVPIDQGFKSGYWAHGAMTTAYRNAFVTASYQFASHMRDRGYNNTFFEFFLNGKINFKRGIWSNASSPWIFDEPVNMQDFWALRWFGSAFHEGINVARQPGHPFPKMVFRADISRPQWQRDTLADVLDVNVVGGAFVQYQRYVNERQKAYQQIVMNYGDTNPISAANTQPAAWCVDVWLRNGNGVLPWQTMGNASSWQKADTHSLFYPGGPAGLDEPVPSIRLKAYRAGQQLTEYLTILSMTQKLPRWAMDQAVRDLALMDAPNVVQHGEEAAKVTFKQVTPQSLWRLRTALGMMLDRLAPPDRDQWVNLHTPRRTTGADLRRSH